MLVVEKEKRLDHLRIEAKFKESDLSFQERKELDRLRHPAINKSQLTERFSAGAKLWIAKLDGAIVGFVWTMKGSTLRPYFFPMLEEDAHLFDNEIGTFHRGRGINPVFINHVLYELKNQGICRVFMETKVWNWSEIRSLQKTRLKRFCVATKYNLGRRSWTLWTLSH
jgi:hypothetical protein